MADEFRMDLPTQSPITFVDDPSVPTWSEAEAKRIERENTRREKSVRPKQKGSKKQTRRG